MTLVKHSPVAFSNLFDELFNNWPAAWSKADEPVFSSVPVNIHETNDGYVLELNAPGRNKEDFNVNIENGLLTISYEKKEENEVKEHKTIRKEFSYQSFKRSFTIDDNIKAEGIEAKYDNGVLNIYLPKKEEVKVMPKQITIK